MSTTSTQNPIATYRKVSFTFDAEPIGSLDQIEAIMGNPANHGRTFHVTKEVFDHFNEQLRPQITPTSPEDIARINRLIGTNFPGDVVMGFKGDCVCPNCNQNLSFADHVESVIRMGLHSPDDLRRLLSGTQFFLTVGIEQTREMLCTKCGAMSLIPRRCYSGSSYAYAEPYGHA
jgi:hypothetical protein